MEGGRAGGREEGRKEKGGGGSTRALARPATTEVAFLSRSYGTDTSGRASIRDLPPTRPLFLLPPRAPRPTRRAARAGSRRASSPRRRPGRRAGD